MKKQQQSLEELCVEILDLKDKYIARRINAIVEGTDISGFPDNKYIREFFQENCNTVNQIMRHLNQFHKKFQKIDLKFYQNSINILLDSDYRDLNLEYIKEDALEFFGGKDTIAFASIYNDYAEDFMALSNEFFLLGSEDYKFLHDMF